MKIAFIGIGNMGLPMAFNLQKAGLNPSVFDLSPKAKETAAQGGLKVATSIEECAKDADVIISMLPASQHVEDLYNNTLFKVAPKTTLMIDCSTIAPDAARRVQKSAAANGYTMIDAPVSGGTGAATAGTLTFMVGGEKAPFEKAKPVLEKMGKKVFHAGPSGCGQVAKVCNNMLLAIHMIGTCEALAMGKNLGLDPKILSEIMLQSSGRNWSLEVYNPHPGIMENVPSSKDYTGGFGVQLMCKDLNLAAEAALSTKSRIPMGELARNLYELHRSQGWAEKDFSSILKFIHAES